MIANQKAIRAFAAVIPPSQGPPPSGSAVDRFLVSVTKDLEQKLRNKVVIPGNGYFKQMEKLFRMMEDPRNGTLSTEASVAAVIYLSIMLANSMPRLNTFEVINGVSFLYHLSQEIGFRLPKEHMLSIMAAIKDPLPSKRGMHKGLVEEMEKILPFFLRILTRVHDPSASEAIRAKVGALTDRYSTMREGPACSNAAQGLAQGSGDHCRS